MPDATPPPAETASAGGDTLSAALARHGIALEPLRIEQLDRYCRLLWDWNSRINLTRHTDYERFVARDVVDCRVLARHLELGERVLDVGSGGGVPGLVLAILRPDLDVTLSESVGKKARVLSAIVKELGLPVRVHAGRAEQLLEHGAMDALVIRAVAPLETLLRWFTPHAEAAGRLLVVKGPAWVEERFAARQSGALRPWELRKLESWPLVGTERESVLLQLVPRR